MKTNFKCLGWMACVALFVTVFVAGCLPERVTWSPDGTRAAVLGDDGLHLCDPAGKLSPLLVERVVRVQWMPDSKRVVVIREVELKSWKEIAAAFPEEAAEAVQNAPKAVQDLQGHEADWVAQLGLAVFYLREQDPAALKAKLASAWDDISAKTLTAYATQIYDVAQNQAKPGPVLLWSQKDMIRELRVSPTGQAVAVSEAEESKGDMNECGVRVVAADGSGVRMKVDAALFPDWSPDGKYLYYITPKGQGHDGAMGLGALVRRRLVDEQGALLTKELPAEEDLAGLLYENNSRVRVAKDGRVFFLAIPVTLPATPADVNPAPILFSVFPGKQATVARVVPRNAENDLRDAEGGLIFFDVSPDGQWISLPCSDGRIKVMSTGTGEITLAQPKALSKSGYGEMALRSVPVWRTPTELTFVSPREDGAGNEVVRYSVTDKSMTVISAAWPQAVGNRWLTEPAPATQPKP